MNLDFETISESATILLNKNPNFSSILEIKIVLYEYSII